MAEEFPPGSSRFFPTASLARIWAIVLILLPGSLFGVPHDDPGRKLYLESCGACHGSDGRGAPRERVGFDTEIPDFTDCSFASREPDADWIAVAHQGGPVRGFDRRMPAFGDALDDHSLELVMAHVRTFCPDRSWPAGELNLPRALFTEKAYPEDEFVYTMTAGLQGTGSVSHELLYEKRFGARNQVELVVPFGGQDFGAAKGWEWGLQDVAVALKRAVAHSRERGSVFSVVGEVVLPTGDRDRGFGKGTTVFEPFVSFGQILPADSFIQLQTGLELPVDRDRAGREGFWRVATGKTFTEGRFGRAWTPMMELLGARELESGATVHWDAVPQIQFTLNTRQHLMANVGVRFPVNERHGRDTQLVFYFLWDWFDGGLTEGW